MRGIEFELSPSDCDVALDVAKDWNRQAVLKHGCNEKYFNDAPGIRRHYPSAIAQLACSIYLNRAWVALLEPYIPGRGIAQIDGCVVKTTFHLTGGLLINDEGEVQPLDVPWVLVVLDRRVGHGWIVGYHIPCLLNLEPYWRTDIRYPAYIWPQRLLLPIDHMIER
jgi:hypothetical protein